MQILMSEMTWEDYVQRINNSVIFLPIGSTEQHGYHLPLGVDYYQINEITKLLAKEVHGIVAPAIPYGFKSMPHSGGGQIFPGTTSLNGETLVLLVKDILKEFIRHGAKKIVVMDGHYENSLFLSEAIDLTLKEIPDNKDIKILKSIFVDMLDDSVVHDIFPYKFPGYDLEHAGLIETSMMAMLKPNLVDYTKIVPDRADNLPPYEIFPQPKNIVPKSGVLSDPSEANSEKGKKIIDNILKNCIHMIKKEFDI